MRNLFICFIALIMSLAPFVLKAQEHNAALKMLEQRGEIYVKFKQPTHADLRQLNKIMSVDKLVPNKSSNEIYAYLNTKQYSVFSGENIDFEMLTPPSMLMDATMCTDLGSVENWNCYPTYSQYVGMMQAFETNYPDLCKLVEFGQSVDGRKLLTLKISDNAGTKEEEPEFFYTSTMHGDETTGYVLMLRLIDYLLSNYGTDSRVTDLVNNTEIWINPLSNPDGTYAGGNITLNGATRGNSNLDLGGNATLDGRVDLNRNFPDPIEGEHPDNNDWQPETIAMMDFLKSHNFVLVANFHGGAEVVNYPWDSWKSVTKKHADDALYQEISREYADTVHANSTGYMTYLNDGITNGGDWYVVSGGRQDYMNYYLHSREVTIELSNIKMVDAATLPAYWEYNFRSFLNYINRVHTGIYGKVTNQDGNPVHAKIQLAYHDADSSEVYSDASNGMYYRMIGGGTYHLIASKPGYAPEEFDVNVPANSNIELNIVLQQYPNAIDEIRNSYARIKNFVNPVSNQLDFNLELAQSENFNLELVDISGRSIVQRKMNGLKGDNQIILDIAHLKEGVYFCRFQSELFNFQIKLFKIDN